MKKQITTRLEVLKAEYQKGQERLAALEQETGNVKSSMLRISGAIQVLEEMLETKIVEKKVANIENGIKSKN